MATLEHVSDVVAFHNQAPRRSGTGFTLIELIISTALALFLMSLATTLWFATEAQVERTRAILALDARMRTISDRYLRAMDLKSGCQPMNAQNHASSLGWDFPIRVVVAKLGDSEVMRGD